MAVDACKFSVVVSEKPLMRVGESALDLSKPVCQGGCVFEHLRMDRRPPNCLARPASGLIDPGTYSCGVNKRSDI